MKGTFVLRRASRAARQRPGAVAALVLAFALLTAIAGSARLFSSVSAALAPQLVDNVHVIAYLRHDAREQRVRGLVGLLREVPGVQAVELVESRQALDRLRQDASQMGGAAELLAGIEEGFLPRSIEVTLAPSAALGSRAERLAASLRRFELVAEVDAMQDGLTALRTLAATLRWLGLGLFALALLSALVALALPLLRGREQRAEEAAVLSMLGATPRGIRLPWALLGAGAACVGAVLGLLLLFVGFGQVMAALSATFAARAHVLPVSFLPAAELLLLVLLAVSLGFVLGKRAVPLPRVRHG